MPDFLAEVLTWPKSYTYALAVETAMNNSVPPTTFILKDKQPSDGWSSADKKLAVAWTVLNKEICKTCGNPLWICRSSDKNLLFSVRKDTCYAKAELERWEKKNKTPLKPGEYPYVVPSMRHDEDPLPRRAAYLAELQE